MTSVISNNISLKYDDLTILDIFLDLFLSDYFPRIILKFSNWKFYSRLFLKWAIGKKVIWKMSDWEKVTWKMSNW